MMNALNISVDVIIFIAVLRKLNVKWKRLYFAITMFVKIHQKN